MLNTIQTEAANEMPETLGRIEALERQIGMLKQAQRYLHGVQALLNSTRIAEQQEELATWQYIKSAQERILND